MANSAEVRGAGVLTGVQDRPSQCSTNERVEPPPLDQPTAQQSSGAGQAVPYGRAATAVLGGGASTISHPGFPAEEPAALSEPGGSVPWFAAPRPCALMRPGSEGRGATGSGS